MLFGSFLCVRKGVRLWILLLLVDEDVVEQEQERQFNGQHIPLETHGENLHYKK